MKLALAQINPTIGDLDGNARLIEHSAQLARDAGADAVVFPELALTGYPPKDLLLQEGFVQAAAYAADALGRSFTARDDDQLTLIFGTPLPAGDPTRTTNSLVVFRAGQLVARYDKRLLPTYDVFDEDRYFTPGHESVIIGVAGQRIALTICEDLWRGEDVGFSSRYAGKPDPLAGIDASTADLIINPSASPFVLGKGARHRERLSTVARERRLTVAAVNQVGGNDELVFDGHAAVFGPAGSLLAAAPGFVQHLLLCDLPPAGERPPPDPLLAAPDDELLFRALTLGVRDYARKTGFSSAVIGLSGGIDSAVTAVIAAAALGPDKVLGVLLPSEFSSPGSIRDARELAAGLALPTAMLPIHPAVESLRSSLAAAAMPSASPAAADVTDQNLQSRVRGTLLMALSNSSGRLLLTTGNKSELAVGYCTLYGDMNGGLAVLSDISKQWVYRLARWINAYPRALGIASLQRSPIPDDSISKPPSAELKPGQTDQDTLPPYDELDQVIDLYVEQRRSPASITRLTGLDPAMIQQVVRMIDAAEFKRKQAAIGLKVTGVAFGSGRRVPIAQRYRPTSR